MRGLRIQPARVGRWMLSIGLFLAIWEVVGQTDRVFAIRPFSEVLPVLVDEIGHGELLGATWGTLEIAIAGFVVSTVIGVAFGLFIGVSERARFVFDPLINAAYAAPLSMAIPVVGLYFGLELRAKVFMVVMFAIFVVIINTAAGVRDVPAGMREMGRAFGLSRLDTYRKIIFPWASPHIFTGLRLGASRAVQGAILADLLLRADHLGLYLIDAGSTFDITRLLAGVFFITLVAVSMMALARSVEWWLLRWKAT